MQICGDFYLIIIHFRLFVFVIPFRNNSEYNLKRKMILITTETSVGVVGCSLLQTPAMFSHSRNLTDRALSLTL